MSANRIRSRMCHNLALSAFAGRVRAGFTLLEVMVSMLILSMMVIVIGNMYQQVSESWNVGVDKSEILTSGRGALELMARELSSAVNLSSNVWCSTNCFCWIEENQGDGYYADRPDKIYFASMTGEPDHDKLRRAVIFVQYYIKKDDNGRYNLMRKYGKKTQSQSPGNSRMMIQDVADLQFYAYDNDGDLIDYKKSPLSDDPWPAYVDIYMEVLGRVNAIRAAKADDPADYVNRNAKRFSTRVYFQNRNMDF